MTIARLGLGLNSKLLTQVSVCVSVGATFELHLLKVHQ